MNTYEKCDNCGADEGLHHWDTKQCPKNGVEEWREGRKQEWEKTTFSIEKSQREKLLAENTEQKQLIKELKRQRQELINGLEKIEARTSHLLALCVVNAFTSEMVEINNESQELLTRVKAYV